MITETITYTDYDGVERTEKFYFNLSKPELIELGFFPGSPMARKIESYQTLKAEDMTTDEIFDIIQIVKKLMVAAYGKKSEDGRRLIKGEDFTQLPAYEVLFMQLINDPDKAKLFMNGLSSTNAVSTSTNVTAIS